MALLCSGYLSVRFHGPVLRLKWGAKAGASKGCHIRSRGMVRLLGKCQGWVSVTTSQAWCVCLGTGPSIP